MIIDFHTHIFSGNDPGSRDLFLHDSRYRMLYSTDKAKTADSGTLSDYLDQNNIDAAVAMSFPWIDEKICSSQNEYFFTTSAEYKNRIFPFGMVPYKSGRSVRECVREIKECGLYGIGEIAFYEGIDSGSISYLARVFESATEYSLPVCLHVNEPVGHNYPGKYDPCFGMIYPLLREFSHLNVILSHWGGGLLFYELMPEVREAFRNFFYDTAASPFIYSKEIYGNAISIAGPERILFGSDFPLLGIGRYDEDVKNFSGSEENRKMVMGRNASMILGLES